MIYFRLADTVEVSIELKINTAIETFITDMEQAINRLKYISAQYYTIPISVEIVPFVNGYMINLSRNASVGGGQYSYEMFHQANSVSKITRLGLTETLL